MYITLLHIFYYHSHPALDPDEPMYDTIKKPKWRLSRHDAIFVDVIHTSGQSTWQSAHLGKPTGHADFFVNGFEWTGGQPGCEDFFMKISKSADNNTNGEIKKTSSRSFLFHSTFSNVCGWGCNDKQMRGTEFLS